MNKFCVDECFFLLWLDLEGNDLTIKLMVVNLKEESITFNLLRYLRQNMSIFVIFHLEIILIRIPSVSGVSIFRSKCVDFCGSIDRCVNLNFESE